MDKLPYKEDRREIIVEVKAHMLSIILYSIHHKYEMREHEKKRRRRQIEEKSLQE
jgi:hypothetical protein